MELDKLIILRKNVSGIYSHKYTKTKINADDDLVLEKKTNMDNLVKLIQLFLMKITAIIIKHF